ncbi:ABC transporter substrate-binding protein [Paucibacter sp. KBW04]|uniref:substrate-binding periplasmic protein n=1 Tax=Paucibacter sp. KBW04 TaxID=2153361 RepID=UPI0018CC1ECB|nr:transporter substrate-binding domain-containing protein [Paucibacter sp. KBW04]
MFRSQFLSLFLLACLATPTYAATLSFPQPADGDRSRYGFEFALLEAALAASRPASQKTQNSPSERLQWSAQTMSQARARLEVAAGKLSVVHSVATPELDRQLTPVRFAIDKGLNSQRILLTRKDLLPRLKALRKTEELRTLRFGVLGSWSDRKALQSLGYQVEVTESFSGLFKMLALGRSDAILTGVLNVQQVQAYLAEPSELEWEPSLLLILPAKQQFYTAPTAEGRALAQRLLRGLQTLKANGEFERLHAQYFGEQIEVGRGRRELRLDGF